LPKKNNIPGFHSAGRVNIQSAPTHINISAINKKAENGCRNVILFTFSVCLLNQKKFTNTINY